VSTSAPAFGIPDFGSAAQRGLLQRGRDLFAILGDDPAYTYYGRTVGRAVRGPGPGGCDEIAALAALVRLQGNSHIAIVDEAEADAVSGAIEAQGLVPARYDRLSGGPAAMDAARAILRDVPVPPGLTTHWIDGETPRETLMAFVDVALAHGVLPPSLEIFVGGLRPARAAVLCDAEGQGVACAAASAYLSPRHPLGGVQFWWGMLATRESHRGARLSLRLGAEVMLAMHDAFGFTEAFTGVAPGNAPSLAVCARIGLMPEGRVTLGAADPALLPGGRMTK
jgi:hypothetical protein